MAVWYETGNGLVKTKMARSNLFLDVYLCCPGPSLSEVNDSDLHIPGVYVAALTTAYPHIRPDIWFGMDEPECYDRTLWWQSFIKIARGGYQNKLCNGTPIRFCPNVYFIDCAEPSHWSDIFVLRQHDIKFVWHQNTLAIALHFLIWMGAKKIYFIGCDLGGERDYYHDLKLTEEYRYRNRKLYTQQESYLKQLTHEAKKRDIHMISCTASSPINRFMDFVPIHKALEQSRSTIPSSGQIKYVLDVN